MYKIKKCLLIFIANLLFFSCSVNNNITNDENIGINNTQNNIWSNRNDLAILSTIAREPNNRINITSINNEKNNFYIDNAYAINVKVFNDDIYILGIRPNENNIEQKDLYYWKNGEINYIDTIDDYFDLYFYVSNNVIYICGIENEEFNVRNLQSRKSRIVYWVNNEKYILTNWENNVKVNGIFVYEENIVIFGEIGMASKYWINGIENTLDENGYYKGINICFYFDNDLYFAGYEKSGEEYININEINDRYSIAKYWKNGIGYNISENNINTIISDYYIYNGIIYYLGYEQTSDVIIEAGWTFSFDEPNIRILEDYKYTPVYWINNIINRVPLDNFSLLANKIFVINGNITLFGLHNEIKGIFYANEFINISLVENDKYYIDDSFLLLIMWINI